MSKVLVIGSWHLGSVIGNCLADVGNEVHLWDQTPSVVSRWASGRPPIEEPALNELTQKSWGKKLFWTGKLQDISPSADWIVISYDTPVDEKDDIDLSIVEEGFQTVLKNGISKNANFFLTSQIPVGTSRRFKNEILKLFPQWQGHLMYQPENLRLGEAIKSFTKPDRMVLGVDGKGAEAEKVVQSFRDLLHNSETPMNVMSLESAEMVKHALNSFLGTCIVYANELSEICEKTGANAWDVVASLKQDSRVGPKAFLRPSLGFSGGTLARDVKTLSYLSGKPTAHNFFKHVYDINNHRNDWILKQLNAFSPGSSHVVLLGVTYKPFTSTVRRSPALEIGTLLRKMNVTCTAIDPQADLNELTDDERKSLPFQMTSDATQAFKNADAAIVVTEWPQFKELNWAALKNAMKKPVVIDCKKLLEGSILKDYVHVVPGLTLEQARPQ